MRLGEKVWELGKAKKLGQRALADACGISFPYISKIENHRLDFGDVPAEAVFEKSAAALDADVTVLLVLAEKISEPSRSTARFRPSPARPDSRGRCGPNRVRTPAASTRAGRGPRARRSLPPPPARSCRRSAPKRSLARRSSAICLVDLPRTHAAAILRRRPYFEKHPFAPLRPESSFVRSEPIRAKARGRCGWPDSPADR